MPSNHARETIKLTNAAFDELNGEIIVRGVLDPKSLHLIQTDDYQREVLPIASQSSLITAFLEDKFIPDITIGMRGGNFIERADNAKDKAMSVYLQDTTYVIDGLQRISTALHLMRLGKKENPHLGCITYFNTTRESESSLFEILNTRGQKLSANVLIRNLRESNTGVDMMYNLCFDKSFVLYDRVGWAQRMRRTELLTALMLIKTVGMLHSTFGPGLSSRYYEVAKGLEKTMNDTVGRNTMRDNTKTFFEVIDGAWGIKSVAFKVSAPYLRGNFLMALAQVIAHHKNFWNDRKLVISSDIRSKIRIFPINDPQIRSMAAGGGSTRGLLYRLILDHLNSGKRKNYMVPFKASDPEIAGHSDDLEEGGE
jgi:hypothetical protein